MPFFAWLMFRLTSHWKQFRISGSSRIGNDLPVQAHPALDNSAGCHPAPQAIELIGALVKRSAPRGAGGAGFRSPAAEASARPARSGPRHPAARLAADRFRQRPGAGALRGALLAAGSVPARASRRAGLSTTAGERACPTVHGAVGEIG